VGATLRGRSWKPVGVLRSMGLERAFAAERPSPSEREEERLRKRSCLSHKKKTKVVRAVHRGKGFAKSLPSRRGTASDLEKETVCCIRKKKRQKQTIFERKPSVDLQKTELSMEIYNLLLTKIHRIPYNIIHYQTKNEEGKKDP
jgi:hypothetical protein